MLIACLLDQVLTICEELCLIRMGKEISLDEGNTFE